ncbi:signal peptidase I [Naasia sp. SYSU D00948]|uniref:signal peptidase I n=1 Tax=Naasia sp. SYSU D00948 TaxID=2817379 RepID=UPI001B314837|nr:signal peptidase I [Naasia sp. SYSU D00948]
MTDRRDIVGSLRTGLAWGLLALVAALALVSVGVPALTGATPLAVLTGSMSPTLPTGTLVVVRPVPMEQIQLGDIVTYQIVPGDPAVVSHRVVEVHSVSDGTFEFITQGDDNTAPDPAPVRQEQVKGVVWYSIPLLGWVSIAVGSHGAWLAPLAGVALLAYASVLIGSGVLARSRRTGAASAALPD